jgi:hypothetical protein
VVGLYGYSAESQEEAKTSKRAEDRWDPREQEKSSGPLSFLIQCYNIDKMWISNKIP